MSAAGTRRSQPQDTPLTYVVLLAYAVFMYPGRRPGSELSLGDWARTTLSAIGDEIQDGESWRLLTYAFVHGNLLHVLVNAASLLALGPTLERWLGSARFAVLYLVGALGGSVAGVFWHSAQTPLVGGSGALFAMMGAILALNMRGGRHLLDFLDHSGARSFLGTIVANLVLGWIIPYVSNAAHLGGMLAGFVLTFCFLERGRMQDRVSAWARAGWATLLATSTLYTCFPTARADYLVRKFLSAPDADARLPYVRALMLVPETERVRDVAPAQWQRVVRR
ncbi:MAG: rhomboid family intramembrane serine protease [Planctomycetota bacterium]